MATEEYDKAKRLGERELSARLLRHEFPYLPALDEILSQVTVKSRVSLGLVQIPLEKIEGTATQGRTTAFAANFMPILDADTEFAAKWSCLYDSLMDEGMRDPITALEYMNRFFVIEGNKRVSVMKYMGAITIEGTVTRIIPERTDDKENKIYYEFLQFYSATKINYLWFTQEGSFARIAAHLGKDISEKWTSEERHEFHSAYLHFAKEYKLRGGGKLTISTGDAFLIYLDVFGYPSLKCKTSAQVNTDIQRIWDEFLMTAKNESVMLLMTPGDEPKKTLISLLHTPPAKLRVAFIYNKTPLTSGWTYSHDLGRQYAEAVFGPQLETVVRENVDADNVVEVIEEVIANGIDVIFTTSPIFVGPMLKPSVEHPEVKMLNCSLIASRHHIRSYYLRMYEAKFILGAIAGSMAENNNIGYVGDYPIYGMPASVNAFAIGARMVNPRAKVYLEWSTMKDHDPDETFRRKNVIVINNRDISAPIQNSLRFGLYRLVGETPIHLAAPVWHWGKLYESLLRSIFKGTWKNDAASYNMQAINYWWGMSSESLDISCSTNLSDGTLRLVDLLRRSIQAGACNPFSGVLYSQDGTERNSEFSTLSPASIITMDWLVENIVGRIPSSEELKEEAQQIVRLQGLRNTIAPEESIITWSGTEKDGFIK